MLSIITYMAFFGYFPGNSSFYTRIARLNLMKKKKTITFVSDDSLHLRLAWHNVPAR